MAAKAVEGLKEDFLHCPICTNRFKVPKILPCIHSFCQECLEKNVQRLESMKVPCPVCREICDLTDTGVKGLQTNFHLVNLAERMDLLGRLDSTKTSSLSCDSCESTHASSYCLECNTKICGKCQNDHKRFPTLRLHSIIPIDEIKQAKYKQVLQNAKAPFCDIHPTEHLRFYCTSCSKLICRDCTVVQHPKPDHDCVEASRQLDEMKTDLLTLLKESSSDIESCLNFIKTGKEGTKNVERSFNALSKEIKSTYEKMMTAIERQLRKQMEKMCAEIEESKTSQLKRIDERVEGASTWMIRLENTREVTQKVINENNMWEILAMSHDLINAFLALKYDAEDFQWHESEVNNMVTLSKDKLPSLTLGKCSVKCDVVVSDNTGNFIMVSFDRHNSNLHLIRVRKDNAYDLVNADHIPPYHVETAFPVNAKITATFEANRSFVLVGLGRWVVQFNCSSNLFEQSFEISEDEGTCITFLGYSDCNNVINIMHSPNRSVKQINYNMLRQLGKPQNNIKQYTQDTRHKIPDDFPPIEIVCCFNYSLLYLCKEDKSHINKKLYLLSQGESMPVQFENIDTVQSKELVSVFNGRYQGNEQVLNQSSTRNTRYVTIDIFTCYILWRKVNLFSQGIPSTYIITEYQSRSKKNVNTWNVPVESAQPAACFKDSLTNQLIVCDLYGKVSTCDKQGAVTEGKTSTKSFIHFEQGLFTKVFN